MANIIKVLNQKAKMNQQQNNIMKKEYEVYINKCKQASIYLNAVRIQSYITAAVIVPNGNQMHNDEEIPSETFGTNIIHIMNNLYIYVLYIPHK